MAKIPMDVASPHPNRALRGVEEGGMTTSGYFTLIFMTLAERNA
jgi:hypothetical protein